jgi:hypothetical protein
MATNRELLEQSGLPGCVTRSRDDWAYFLFFGYHQVGNWNTPPDAPLDFRWDELGAGQQRAVEELRVRWGTFCSSHPILGRRVGKDQER